MCELPPDIEKVKILFEKHKKMFYPSRFKFLQAINGIRPGCMHGLLAPTGMGKSTLTRSIITDVSENTKCGIILSEEKFEEYSAGFVAQSEPVNWSNVRMIRETKIVSEFETKEMQIKAIVSLALEADIKVLFWDNITTGTILGDSVKPDLMARLIELLKHELFTHDIALFFIAHTGKGVKTEQASLFQGEDVRGSNQYYMKADYFFNLQVKTKNDEKVSFVNITKSRFHQPKNKFYVLEFIVNKYTRDVAVTPSVIAQIFEKETKSAVKSFARKY